MATRISTAARNAAADAIAALVDGGSAGGTIRIYSGTQPAGPDSGVGAATLLAEITLDDPAFGAATSGVATLADTPLTATGVEDGTAAWFRLSDSEDAPVLDGAVGTSGAELNLNTLTISTGVNVEITSGTITMPAS